MVFVIAIVIFVQALVIFGMADIRRQLAKKQGGSDGA